MSGYLEGVMVLLAVNVVFAYGGFLPLAAGQLNLGLAGFAAISIGLSSLWWALGLWLVPQRGRRAMAAAPLVIVLLHALLWQQRMLALARVLVEPPAVLVADELSLGLAPIIVDEVFALISKSVKKDKRFVYPGFGTFMLKKRAARVGRNPRTNAEVRIPVTKTITFKPAPNLKSQLQQ